MLLLEHIFSLKFDPFWKGLVMQGNKQEWDIHLHLGFQYREGFWVFFSLVIDGLGLYVLNKIICHDLCINRSSRANHTGPDQTAPFGAV